MRAAIMIMFLLVMPVQGWARTIDTIYKESDIYAMSVEGFRLNMTQEEASRILKKNQWEGQWREFAGPELEYPFRRGGATLYLMRYKGRDNQLHIWSVVSKQEFDRPAGDSMPVNRVLGQIWIDSIVAHYGKPSVDFINPNGVNAYVYYLSSPHAQDAAKLEIYLGRNEVTYELTDRSIIAGK